MKISPLGGRTPNHVIKIKCGPALNRKNAILMRFWAERSYRAFGVGVRTVEAWIIVACDRDAPRVLRGDLVFDDPSEPRAPFCEKCRDAETQYRARVCRAVRIEYFPKVPRPTCRHNL